MSTSMTRPVLVYGRFHTTSCIFIHVLKFLLEQHSEELRGFHFHFLLDDRRDLPLIEAMLPPDRVTVYPQYQTLKPYLKNRSWPTETLDRWEKLYGAPHLKTYLLMERALEDRPEEVKWRYLLSHVEYFEKLQQEIRPALFISGAADGLSPWVALSVMKAHGVPILSFSPSRFGNRSFILDNPFEMLHVGPSYRQFRREGLSEEQRNQAQALVTEYRQKSVKPLDHLAIRAKHRLRRILPNPISAVRLMRESFFTDTGLFDLPLPVAMRRALCGRRTWFYNKWLTPHQLQEIPPDEKFFFFPLQYEPEISLATQGRGWTKQLELAKLISNSLPIDRWLYIKEHPSMLSGIRPFGFYREILKLPHVRLIRQYMDSYQIVPQAEAILTITGTAGWEALMFGRPVVLFGHSFYEEFEEGVIRAQGREELPGILRQIRHRNVSEEAILAYVAAVLTKTRTGLFIEPRYYSDLQSEILGPSNLADIGQVIREHLAAV